MKPHLPEHMGWKIELQGQPAGMLPSFFCHKAQSTFILCIRFAEDGLALRVIHKTPYAQFIAVCRRSKWSKYFTNSPLLALHAMVGSSAARKISSACSKAFC